MKLNLNIKNLQTKLSRLLKKLALHASFAAIIATLLIYILVVWRISSLATAEPSSSDEAAASTQIPKIDQKAINQIQALEQSSTEVHSLFTEARNNPFQE
jgi:hypothetical protein